MSAAGSPPSVTGARRTRHLRAGHPGLDSIPVAGRDRLRGPDRSEQRKVREPEPDSQAGGQERIRVPQPRKSAPESPDRLQPRHPAITEHDDPTITSGDRPETRSRLTSKSRESRYLRGSCRGCRLTGGLAVTALGRGGLVLAWLAG